MPYNNHHKNLTIFVGHQQIDRVESEEEKYCRLMSPPRIKFVSNYFFTISRKNDNFCSKFVKTDVAKSINRVKTFEIAFAGLGERKQKTFDKRSHADRGREWRLKEVKGLRFNCKHNFCLLIC